MAFFKYLAFSCRTRYARRSWTPVIRGSLNGQLAAIARRQFETNCACFTPNEGRVEDILQMVEDYQADGVVHFSLSFCQPYNLEAIQIRKALQAADIPVLVLDGDYSEEQAGQLKTRIEAFIETL